MWQAGVDSVLLYNRRPMSRVTRLFALSVSLLLLALPTAWACEELTSGTLECSRMEAAKASTDGMCHEESKPSMDCCAAHQIPEPKQSVALESAESLSSLVSELHLPVDKIAAEEYSAAPDAATSRWRGQGCYSLFSSYLL
jgi:hypothetical protein